MDMARARAGLSAWARAALDGGLDERTLILLLHERRDVLHQAGSAAEWHARVREAAEAHERKIEKIRTMR